MATRVSVTGPSSVAGFGPAGRSSPEFGTLPKKRGKGSSAKITLPVSMEDADLFSRTKLGMNDHPRSQSSTVQQMLADLDKVWWSRLITACRGYVANDFKHDEGLVFLIDDVFIYLHRCVIEGTPHEGLQIMQDIDLLETVDPEVIHGLSEGVGVPEEHNPFSNRTTVQAFERLFGRKGPDAYERAFKQGFAFLVFFNIFCKLQERFRTRAQKTKAVTFETDPEWQPDDRVVIFEKLSPGNRTWVLSDFDRHIVMYWKPHGTKIIFGDRYIQSRTAEGYKLCAHCGLLELERGQFRPCDHCRAQGSRQPAHYCSSECQRSHMNVHRNE